VGAAALVSLRDRIAWFGWHDSAAGDDDDHKLLFFRCLPSNGVQCESPHAPVALRTANSEVLAAMRATNGTAAALIGAPRIVAPDAYFFNDSVVAFVPLARGIGGLQLNEAALRAFAIDDIELGTDDVVQLRAMRAYQSPLPVLLYANSSGVVQMLQCDDTLCAVNGTRRAFGRRFDRNTSLSIVATQNSSIVASWISQSNLVFVRCPKSGSCAQRVLIANATGNVVVAVVDAVAVVSPISGFPAFAFVENKPSTSQTVLRVRVCADDNCTAFVGDAVGRPVPSGYGYVYTTLVGAILAVLLLSAIPVLFTARRHQIR
jgi:hypothetical protein